MSTKEMRSICQTEKLLLPPRHFGYNIHRIWSIYITRFFIKVNLNANQITCISIVLGLIGFILSCYSSFIFSIIVYYFSFLLDKCDGEVARFTNQKTKLGTYLDEIYHLIINPIIYFGVGVGLANNYFFDTILIGLFASFLCLLFFALSKVKYVIKVKTDSDKLLKNEENRIYIICRFFCFEDIVIYMLTLGYLFSKLEIILYFYVILFLVLIFLEIGLKFIKIDK